MIYTARKMSSIFDEIEMQEVARAEASDKLDNSYSELKSLGEEFSYILDRIDCITTK